MPRQSTKLDRRQSFRTRRRRSANTPQAGEIFHTVGGGRNAFGGFGQAKFTVPATVRCWTLPGNESDRGIVGVVKDDLGSMAFLPPVRVIVMTGGSRI
jgi:hypothetical protein